MSAFNTIEEAIDAYKKGEILIVVDDEDRENEGDFIMAASAVTADKINFMASEGRGLICVPMTEDRLRELELSAMVQTNSARHNTQFTVSVDALQGTTTGISAPDRAITIKTLIDPDAVAKDLARPGHIFPIKAEHGGVLSRAGHTEATIDLARLAGLYPAGVLCEVMDDNGEMARVPKLLKIANKHNLKIITIRDLIAYRHRTEHLVNRKASIDFPTKYGHFQLHLYQSDIDEHHHLAIVKGEVNDGDPVIVRVHSQCLTGDLLGSMRCDCGDQLHCALETIEKAGRGVLLYMRQEGRGIGLANKILAYQLQDNGRDTVEANEELGFQADLRDYGIGAQILVDLGIHKIRLLTNNPKKIVGLQGYNLEVVERIPIEIAPNHINAKYLETKRDKLGHLILN